MDGTPPRIIVGLGNPGAGYAGHRHNIGFRVVAGLAARRGLVFGPPTASCRAATANDVVLMQPWTYMNRSGDALVAWADAAGLRLIGSAPPPAPSGTDADGATETGEALQDPAPDPAPDPGGVRPLVVCDDLALPLGAVRLRAAGGSGGQNGLASIIARLGGEEFPRLRLGIAPPAGVAPADWADYVLADFLPDETAAVEEAVDWACDALECWLEQGFEPASSRYNRRRPPAG